MTTFNKKTGNVSEFDDKSAVEIKNFVEEKIKGLKDGAFLHNGWFVVYSGPPEDWTDAWKKTHTTPFYTNKKRAEETVNDWGAATVWLDKSPIGLWLEDEELYACLEAKNGGRNSGYYADVDLVFAAASKAYIKKAFGHVATAVCGAGHTRMFYSVELKALVRNKRVETINGLPRELVKKFYDINPDEAFQLVCWSELVLAKRKADSDPLDAKVRDDYEQRLFYFNQEREHTKDNSKLLPSSFVDKRHKKRLAIFTEYATELTANNMHALLDDVKNMSIYDLPLSKASSKKCAALSP